jgi:hypothetical protein
MLIRKKTRIKKWPDSGKRVKVPDRVDIMPIEGMPMVSPTRLMFEQEELDRVVYHMHDGRVVEYKRIDDVED